MNRLFALLVPTICLAQEASPPPEEVGAKFSATVVESRFGTTVADPSRLRGEIYYVEPGSTALPDFAKLKPVGAIYTNGLNIPQRSFDEGFPGVTDRFEWFAIDYTGRFHITNAGRYQFQLMSDDGAILYIDGTKVVDNDGLHPVRRKEGSMKLSTGTHTIRLSYFQGPRDWAALILKIHGPKGSGWRIFNTDEFKVRDATGTGDR